MLRLLPTLLLSLLLVCGCKDHRSGGGDAVDGAPADLTESADSPCDIPDVRFPDLDVLDGADLPNLLDVVPDGAADSLESTGEVLSDVDVLDQVQSPDYVPCLTHEECAGFHPLCSSDCWECNCHFELEFDAWACALELPPNPLVWACQDALDCAVNSPYSSPDIVAQCIEGCCVPNECIGNDLEPVWVIDFEDGEIPPGALQITDGQPDDNVTVSVVDGGPCCSGKALYIGDPECMTYYSGDLSGCEPVASMTCVDDGDCPEDWPCDADSGFCAGAGPAEITISISLPLIGPHWAQGAVSMRIGGDTGSGLGQEFIDPIWLHGY